MNQIEIAKLIISREGNCAGVSCKDCQAYIYINKGLGSCNEIWGADDDKKRKDWFKNWLKEQEEKNMSNKIQMTEEQFYNMAIICFKREPLQIEIVRARENGYIIKSELQQKVEEAERMYYNFSDYKYFGGQYKRQNDDWQKYACDLTKNLFELIQLLKQSHPEFKEK